MLFVVVLLKLLLLFPLLLLFRSLLLLLLVIVAVVDAVGGLSWHCCTSGVENDQITAQCCCKVVLMLNDTVARLQPVWIHSRCYYVSAVAVFAALYSKTEANVQRLSLKSYQAGRITVCNMSDKLLVVRACF